LPSFEWPSRCLENDMDCTLEPSHTAKNNLKLILSTGDFTKMSRLPTGSNMAYESVLTAPGEMGVRVVYKPAVGEAPLRDFPAGSLYKREYAAYLLSDLLGWGLVPCTVIREGPHGIGMVQKFIDHDPVLHYFSVNADYVDEFKLIATFDLLLNNADRKSSHCLLDKNGRVWSIDHGVTFHEEPKHRTVIWDYVGQKISKNVIDDLSVFNNMLAKNSSDLVPFFALLNPLEQKAFIERLNRIILDPIFPEPDTNRRSYPWPML